MTYRGLPGLALLLAASACDPPTESVDPPVPPARWSQLAAPPADYHSIAASHGTLWASGSTGLARRTGTTWSLIPGVAQPGDVLAARDGSVQLADGASIVRVEGDVVTQVGELSRCAGPSSAGFGTLPIQGVGDRVFIGCHYYTGFASWKVDGSGYAEADAAIPALDLWAVDPAHVVIATSFDGVLRWNGSPLGGDDLGAYEVLMAPTEAPPRAVWADAAGDLVVALDGGALLVAQGGGPLAPVTPPGDSTLFDIWGRRFDDLIGVGARGAIWHFDGTAWTALASPTTADLRSVTGSDDGAIFAAGDGGTILRGEP